MPAEVPKDSWTTQAGISGDTKGPPWQFTPTAKNPLAISLPPAPPQNYREIPLKSTMPRGVYATGGLISCRDHTSGICPRLRPGSILVLDRDVL